MTMVRSSLMNEGGWFGDRNEGIGRVVGSTIAHEAGHSYGIATHPTAGLMEEGRSHIEGSGTIHSTPNRMQILRKTLPPRQP